MKTLYPTNTTTQKGINAAQITEALGGRRSGLEYVARCPAHDDSEPSLSLRDAPDGLVLVHCFGGCEQSRVIDALCSLGLWRARSTGRLLVVSPSPEPDKRKLEAVRRVWSKSRQVTSGDPVDRYLRGRGIHLDEFPRVLRLHPALAYWVEKEFKGCYPAMIALLEGPQGDLVSAHRTYLAPNGSGKAPVPDPKKLMSPDLPGRTRGAAIRLYEPREVLAVAEGIETALAVHACTGLPCWATISAGGMKSVEIPDSVSLVIICADHDASQTGERAGKVLARRILAEGRRCKLLMPQDTGADWADFLEVNRVEA